LKSQYSRLVKSEEGRMARSSRPAEWGRTIEHPNEDWLALQEPEPILDPELPIIDPHHHFWERRGEGLGHRYLLDELLADIDTGHNIEATVFLECRSMYRAEGPPEMRPVGETEFVAGLAAMSASGGYGKTRVAAGIVGYADLLLGARVEPVLEAHIRAGGGRFRGVRHSAGWDASDTIGNSRADMRPGLYARPDFRAGLATLANRGLSFDAWLYHPQLGDVVDLARAFPAAPIVMGHVGGVLGYGPYAGKKDEVFAVWKRGMTDLAACPNVVVKLGGQMRRLATFDYGLAEKPPSSEELARYWRPYMHTCIELFGANRCMFESNFPVEKVGTGYAVLWNAFKRIAAGASADEKRALFADTARRFYRLGNAEAQQ
jgi:predicted TIM-barrel fold metal-dependent hydrolase